MQHHSIVTYCRNTVVQYYYIIKINQFYSEALIYLMYLVCYSFSILYVTLSRVGRDIDYVVEQNTI